MIFLSIWCNIGLRYDRYQQTMMIMSCLNTVWTFSFHIKAQQQRSSVRMNEMEIQKFSRVKESDKKKKTNLFIYFFVCCMWPIHNPTIQPVIIIVVIIKVVIWCVRFVWALKDINSHPLFVHLDLYVIKRSTFFTIFNIISYSTSLRFSTQGMMLLLFVSRKMERISAILSFSLSPNFALSYICVYNTMFILIKYLSVS